MTFLKYYNVNERVIGEWYIYLTLSIYELTRLPHQLRFPPRSEQTAALTWAEWWLSLRFSWGKSTKK